MYSRSRRFYLIIPAVSFLLTTWTGCREQPAAYDFARAGSRLSAQQTGMLTRLLGKYDQLKNALVNEESGTAHEAALGAKAALDSLIQADSTLINHVTADTLVRQLEKIGQIRDESCERQRIEFRTLSSSLYTLLQQTGLHHVTVYRQYCPMALNEAGGSWLSASPGVENPYFGDKMLSCGEVTDTLR